MGDVRKRVGPHSLAAHVQRQSAASNDFAAAVVALDSVGCMRLGRLQVIRSLEAGYFYFRSGCGSSDSLRPAHFSFPLSFAMRMPPNYRFGADAGFAGCSESGAGCPGPAQNGR